MKKNRVAIVTKINQNPSKAGKSSIQLQIDKTEEMYFKELRRTNYLLIEDQKPDLTFDDIFLAVTRLATLCKWDTSDCSNDKDIFLKFMLDENTEDLVYEDMSLDAWFDKHCISTTEFQTVIVDKKVPLGLAVCRDKEGYFLSIVCNAFDMTSNAIRLYLLLVSMNYPVWFPGAEKIVKLMNGTRRIAVIPNNVDVKTGYSMFPANTFASEIMYADDMEPVAFPDKIEWF